MSRRQYAFGAPPPQAPSHHDTASCASPAYAAFLEARETLIERWSEWLRQAKPSSDDVNIEADGTGSMLRQIAAIEAMRDAGR